MLEACLEAVTRVWTAAPDDTPARKALGERMDTLERWIIAAPAMGPAGLAVKLRQVKETCAYRKLDSDE